MITPESMMVVSGGGRGITAYCVIRLAQRYHCQFILLGRTAIDGDLPAWANLPADEQKRQVMAELTARGDKPTPVKVQNVINKLVARREIEQTITDVAKMGGRAVYLNVDITDHEAVQDALAPYRAQITGVLHGAGNLADKRIENKTAEDFEYVYRTKVDGLQALLNAVDVDRLQQLILFSSAAGFYGNIGQADYALSNEILNKTAQQFQKKYPHCRVLTLNWGPWDGGMVSPELKKLFAERGMQVIPLEGGAQVLIDELDQRRDVQVLVGSPMHAPPTEPDPTLLKWQITRTLTEADNPFVQDHRIGQHAVLPAVHSVAWMGHTAEQLYPGYTFFRLENYRVLKGLVFDEQFIETYLLELQEVEKSAAQIVFDAKISSQQPKTRYHYTARITLVRDVPAAPRVADFNLAENNPLPGAPLYDDGTLFHGPIFQQVERILNMNEHGLTLRCQPACLTPAQMGQFPIETFDPYAADIQFQAMVIWGRKMFDAASLPVSAAQGEQYRPIPPDQPFYVTMRVINTTETQLQANIFTHDAQGQIYLQVLGAEVTLSQQLNKLFVRSS